MRRALARGREDRAGLLGAQSKRRAARGGKASAPANPAGVRRAAGMDARALGWGRPLRTLLAGVGRRALAGRSAPERLQPWRAALRSAQGRGRPLVRALLVARGRDLARPGGACNVSA